MNYDWRHDAACGGGAGDIGGLFFPEHGYSAEYAKEICGVCPVVRECLDFAMASEGDSYRHGVWGGLTPSERQRLRAAARRGGGAQVECGMCGTGFRQSRVNQRYCSGACRSRALRRRQAAYEERKRRANV